MESTGEGEELVKPLIAGYDKHSIDQSINARCFSPMRATRFSKHIHEGLVREVTDITSTYTRSR